MAIYGDQFDWPSFATLATGVMAVAGAVAIGLRQSRITEKQTNILDRQTKISELTLRHELFDRRYDVYSVIRSSIIAVITTTEALDAERVHEIFTAVQKSQFLCGSGVHNKLVEIRDRIDEYSIL